MRVSVRVTPGAKTNKIAFDETKKLLRVWTTTQPEAGKANKAVIEQIAKHLKLAKSAVRLVVGAGTRDKILDIDSDLSIEELFEEPKLF